MLYLIPLYFCIMFFFNYKNKIKFFYMFPFFISLAFQNAIGTDYYNYIRIFHNDIIFKYSRGPLFKVLVNILNKITTNERILFIFVAIIQTFLLYKIILKLYRLKVIKNTFLFILVLIIGSNIYLQMFNILRNSIASLLINLAIIKILEKKTKGSFILILLGSSIHPSVILWNFIYFFEKYLFIKFRRAIIITFILSCYILNKVQFIPYIAKYIYNLNINFTYKFYLISSHMLAYNKTYGIATIISMLYFIFSLRFYYKEKHEKKIYFYNLGYFFFGLRLFFINIPIFNRLLGPTELFQAYIIYTIVVKTLNKKYYYLGGLIIIYYIIYYIRNSLLIIPPI